MLTCYSTKLHVHITVASMHPHPRITHAHKFCSRASEKDPMLSCPHSYHALIVTLVERWYCVVSETVLANLLDV